MFPVLPLAPELCIVRAELDSDEPGTWGYSGQADWLDVDASAAVAVYTGRDVYRNSEERDIIRLKMEIHELCHINQHWQTIPELTPDYPQHVRVTGHPLDYFNDSPQFEDFNALVGFELEPNGWEWSLPAGNVYRDIYAVTPRELSAELCSMYLMDMMGMRSSYDYERYDYDDGFYVQVAVRRVNVNKYLTLEVRAWLEEWMILPQIDD